jgi:ubiquinone/menaquinone biosynthesis C-methylase UbiE
MNWEEAVAFVRSDPSQQKLVIDYFFDDPLPAACERYRVSTEWAAVRKMLPAKRGSVLEVGAGRGIAAYALAMDGWEVTALEPDPSPIVGAAAIESLNGTTPARIRVVQTWGEKLPFDAATFDVVFCRQALHHAHDLRLLCCEMARVLKGHGKMVAIREHVLSSRQDLPTFLNNHPMHRYYEGENAYLLEEYLDAMKQAGLRIKKVFNPLSSDVNLYPLTQAELKQRIVNKYRIPSPALIPDWILRLKGSLMDTPGRPYSFIAEKP